MSFFLKEPECIILGQNPLILGCNLCDMWYFAKGDLPIYFMPVWSIEFKNAMRIDLLQINFLKALDTVGSY